MERILICLLLLTGLCTYAYGQSEATAGNEIQLNEQYADLELALDKLTKKLENVSVDIRRAAPLQWEYEESKITSEGFKLIRNEIERTIFRTGRIKVLDIEALQDNQVLKISGSDSSLKISNAANRNQEDYDEQLMRLSEQYSVDAFLKGHVQYQEDMGFIITLEFINPRSKAIDWSTTVMSKDVESKKEIPTGRRNILSGGVNLNSPSEYVVNTSTYSDGLNLLNYNLNYTYRQPVNPEHSSYFGISAGYHVMNLTYLGDRSDVESFSKSIMNTGVYYFKTLGKKPNTKRQYWIELFIGPEMKVVFNDKNHFQMSQGLHLNFTKNLGMELNLNFLISGSSRLTNEEETKEVELNNTSYGLKLLLKF